MGSTLIPTLVCALGWLGGPDTKEVSPPPSKSIKPTEVSASPKSISEAERIAQIRRRIETDQAHLQDLKKRIQDPKSEYHSAEAEFQKLDTQKRELEKAISKLDSNGEKKMLAVKQAQLTKIQKPWQAARERFDFAIQERKTTQQAITTLQKKILDDQQLLTRLTTPQPTPPPTPGTTVKNAPTPPPQAVQVVAPQATPVKPPVVTPSTPQATPAKSASALPEKQPTQTETRKPSKEVIEARAEVKIKEEKARQANAKAQSLTARMESLRASIQLEEKLLAMAHQKVDRADDLKDSLEKKLKERVEAGAPEAELQSLWQKIDQIRQRIQAGRTDARAHSDRLHELNAELTDLQTEHIAALNEAQKKREEAAKAQQKLADLQNPFHLGNIWRWIHTHAVKLVLIVLGMLMFRWLAKKMSGRAVKVLAKSGLSKRGHPKDRENRAQTLVEVFQNALSLLVLCGGLLMVLDEMDIPIAPLMGGVAVIGLAVAFGAQNLIRDYFSGFMVLVEDQYGINDVVKIGNVAGVVEHISLRVTSVRDLEGTLHFIPHGTLSTVSNLTYGWSRALFDIGIAYKEDVDRVMEVLFDLAKSMRQDPFFGPLIMDNPEMLGVDSFNDSAVIIRFFIKTMPMQQWTVKREMLRRIKKRFDELNIEIPFPHRTLYHRGDSTPVMVSVDGKEKMAA